MCDIRGRDTEGVLPSWTPFIFSEMPRDARIPGPDKRPGGQDAEVRGTSQDPDAWSVHPGLLQDSWGPLAEFFPCCLPRRWGEGRRFWAQMSGPALGASPGTPDGGRDGRGREAQRGLFLAPLLPSRVCSTRVGHPGVTLNLSLPSSSCTPLWQRLKSWSVDPREHSRGPGTLQGKECTIRYQTKVVPKLWC